MTLPTKTKTMPGDAVRHAMVADVWAMSDEVVRAEAVAAGEDLTAVAERVRGLRRQAATRVQSKLAGKLVSLDGRRARAIFERLSARRALPESMLLVADGRTPTEDEALSAVRTLIADGLLSAEDLEL